MARNSEKAMTTLARWRASQAGVSLKDKDRRPYLASDCDNLQEAEKWRRQIIGEISRKVAQIQNAGLGEFKLRDLNDEINKLLREKGHWEDRIKELGGPDYYKTGPKMMDNDGKEVPGNRGYKYFGAAKDLPGVKELFEQEPPPPPRKNRAELMKDIDADYYGCRDEDDGIIVPLELDAEKAAVKVKVREWKEKQNKVKTGQMTEEEAQGKEEEPLFPSSSTAEDDEDMEDVSHTSSSAEDSEQQCFVAHVPVPSQKEIEEALLHRRKMELIQRYASDALQEEETEAKNMLGVGSISAVPQVLVGAVRPFCTFR
ncbi:pre-mRNA-splicing factor ISY1 homolog [Elysia marginata]|uniref:Pre-mRNA-splicing factor ISY1 homolog n=1 Tax=Elysia marginata TaxID=1093978 RepID=A0AAV4JE13_9GAST|nr:pre-mRNA-splicing factor ISY1 homolog [Elysia marginata]